MVEQEDHQDTNVFSTNHLKLTSTVTMTVEINTLLELLILAITSHHLTLRPPTALVEAIRLK